MKLNEAKSLVDLIRNSKLYELFFISLIILPIYLGSWLLVLKQLRSDLWEWEVAILIGLVILYIGAISVMKIYQSKADKILNASLRIRSYLETRNWKKMSYERIRDKIDKSFDDELLDSITKKYTDVFTTTTIKVGKKGIKLKDEEEQED